MGWHERATRRHNETFVEDPNRSEQENRARRIFSWRNRADMMLGEMTVLLPTAPNAPEEKDGQFAIYSAFKPHSPEHLEARKTEYQKDFPNGAPFGMTRKKFKRQQRRLAQQGRI